jgi:uncharacterized glyoxalase superfamily protein PhnB
VVLQSHPVLAVHDLDRSAAWYVAVFGAERHDIPPGAEVLKPPTDEPWGRRELALRSPDGHRFMVANATRA